MARRLPLLLAGFAATVLLLSGCAQSTPTPAAAPPAAAPSKAVEATKSVAVPTGPSSAPEATKPATQAQSSYPAKGKSITFIVPWGAGGGTDVTGRLVAAAMEKELGVPVQVVNKPGASSQVGMTELARSKPDGYTVIISSLPSVLTYLDPARKAAFGRKDIQQVANVAFDPEMLAVRADSQYKSVKELIDAARANPGTISVADGGINSDGHLASSMLQKAAGVKFRLVHFDGNAQVNSAIAGGHVEAALQSAVNFPSLAKAETVRLLAIWDKEESKFFPGVPTLESQGYKLYWASTRGISVPGGTPKEIVQVLAGAIKKATESSEFKKSCEESYIVPRYMGPDEYSAYWDEIESLATPFIESAK